MRRLPFHLEAVIGEGIDVGIKGEVDGLPGLLDFHPLRIDTTRDLKRQPFGERAGGLRRELAMPTNGIAPDLARP